MSQQLQNWIKESFQLLERIRKRFNDCFKIEQSTRSSQDSNDGEVDITAKVQNQWRKLNVLLNKQIPEKQKVVSVELTKKLDLLKSEALRIQNMFKNKFGEEKHNQLKLLEKMESWRSPIFNSGLRKLQSESTRTTHLKTAQYEPIGESQSKIQSSIIQEPEEEQKQAIKNLEEAERRSHSRLWNTRDKQERAKKCGYCLIATLIFVLLMHYITIPMPTKIFTYLLERDL